MGIFWKSGAPEQPWTYVVNLTKNTYMDLQHAAINHYTVMNSSNKNVYMAKKYSQAAADSQIRLCKCLTNS